MDTPSSELLSWPYVLQFSKGADLEPLLDHWAARCASAGLHVLALPGEGLLTVRQSRRYADVFASNVGTIRKPVVGKPHIRRVFNRTASAAFQGVTDPDFYCPSEAAYLTELHLSSIEVDEDSQALLVRICGETKGRGHAARLGASLLEACRSLELLHDAFPEHEPQKVAALWSRSRWQLLPSPTPWREYFGDGVGFYMAWMGHFTAWLAVPSFLGLASASYHIFTGLTVDDNPYAPLYAICMILWATAFNKFWRRRVAGLQLEWHGALAPHDPAAAVLQHHTQGGRASQRHGFTGTLRVHPITGAKELHYPGWKRGIKCAVSWAVTGVMLLAAFLTMIASLNLQGYVHSRNGALHIPLFASFAAPGRPFDPAGHLFFVPTICHAISIFALNSLYRKVPSFIRV